LFGGRRIFFEETILNLPFSTLHSLAGGYLCGWPLPENEELNMED
jgi:hypothetical protein